jgi:hypothetical protein
MNHLNEEQLVLFHYGETEEAGPIKEHLTACGECRQLYDELQQTFSAVEALPVPERGEGYGREVWARLQPQLEEQPQAGWTAWLQPQHWALAATITAVLVVGILVGRFTSPGPNGRSPEQVRERILLVAVGDHLDSSQMVLVELVNATGNGTVDITSEREWAEDLIADNRLYRLTASEAGETAVAGLLEELERVLLEVAHSPDVVSSDEFQQIRSRIEEQGILFKIRVLGSKVREREGAGFESQAPDSSQS